MKSGVEGNIYSSERRRESKGRSRKQLSGGCG